MTLYWKHGDAWAVREGDLKLVAGNTKAKDETADPRVPVLFNLAKDGSETSDLAAQRPDDVKRMLKLYEDWKRDFPKPLWGRGVQLED